MAKAKKAKKVSVVHSPIICSRCNGFGVLADTRDMEPMNYYRHLPAETKELPFYAALKGFNCPDCKGSGLWKAT